MMFYLHKRSSDITEEIWTLEKGVTADFLVASNLHWRTRVRTFWPRTLDLNQVPFNFHFLIPHREAFNVAVIIQVATGRTWCGVVIHPRDIRTEIDVVKCTGDA